MRRGEERVIWLNTLFTDHHKGESGQELTAGTYRQDLEKSMAHCPVLHGLAAQPAPAFPHSQDHLQRVTPPPGAGLSHINC